MGLLYDSKKNYGWGFSTAMSKKTRKKRHTTSEVLKAEKIKLERLIAKEKAKKSPNMKKYYEYKTRLEHLYS